MNGRIDSSMFRCPPVAAAQFVVARAFIVSQCFRLYSLGFVVFVVVENKIEHFAQGALMAGR